MPAGKFGKMATSSQDEHLTNRQIVRLASAIEYKKMKSIALGYLGLSVEKISSLSQTRREDYEAFNREIIHNWRCRNPGSDQIKVSGVCLLSYFITTLMIRRGIVKTMS